MGETGGEFQFLDTKESRFYRNFLRRWESFYPGSRPREECQEERQIGEQEQTQTRTEFQFSAEISKENGPRKILDYKSKKYVEQ